MSRSSGSRWENSIIRDVCRPNLPIGWGKQTSSYQTVRNLTREKGIGGKWTIVFEKNTIRSDYFAILLKEAKKAKDQYQKQLQKLEREFDKLRFSNDHLLEAFRNSMLSSKQEENKESRCRCECRSSANRPDGLIRSPSIKAEVGKWSQGNEYQTLIGSRQPNSCRKNDFIVLEDAKTVKSTVLSPPSRELS